MASALELALLGANVTLLARNEDKLNQTLPSLSKHGTQSHRILVGDLSVPEKLSSVLGKSVRTGRYHILINNTGGPTPGTALESSVQDFESAFKSHLGSAQTLTQMVAPFMKEANYGRIINVISTSVKIPIAGLGVSNTIRGAMASWAKTLSLELGPFGITVNNVLPGSTMTPRLMQVIKSRAEKNQKTVEEVKHEMMMEVPAKRISEPQEVAAMIAFLASPAAGYVNGTSIPVDGGRTGSI